MLIEFKCPCGFVFRTQAANAGKRIKCPECMREQQVPTPPGEKPAPKQPAAAAGKPAKKPPAKPAASGEDDDIEDIPFIEDDGDETFDDALPLPSRKPKRGGMPELPAIARHSSSSGRKKEINPPGYKKQRDEPENKGPGWGLVAGLIGVAVLIVGGGGLALALAMRGGGDAEPVDATPLQVELVPVRHDTSALSWRIPKGWDMKTGGGTGGLPASMSCESDDVRMVLRMTQTGSAMGEAGRAVDNMDGEAEEDPRLQPAAQIHEMMKVVAKDNYPDYQEIGDPQVFQSGLGDSRVSQFTGSGDWGGKIAGYRMTILGVPDSYTVYFTCPAKKWKSHEPLFRDVMKSIGR